MQEKDITEAIELLKSLGFVEELEVDGEKVLHTTRKGRLYMQVRAAAEWNRKHGGLK